MALAVKRFSKPIDAGQRAAIRLEDVQRRWADELERRVREGSAAAGLVGEMIEYHVGTGGKRLRALLPVWVCANLGGRAEEALDACANASLVVASAAVPRLTLGGLTEFLDEVQLGLADIHTQIDRTYFRPTAIGWHPESLAS